MPATTLQERDLRNALYDLTTIDRHITTITEDLAAHRRCGPCWRTRHDLAALEVLFDKRLTAMDVRDCAATGL